MWQWLEKAKTFLSTVTNRILGRDAERSVMSLALQVNLDRAQGLFQALVADQVTIGQWEHSMRDIIKDAVIQQYAAGRGGVAKLTAADYGSIGGMVGEQYRFLSGFAAEIAAGSLTPGQIQMRMNMYVRSANEAFNRGRTRAYGIPDGALPAYPGDGQSTCRTNCKCHWDIVETRDDKGNLTGWDCTWTLSPAEHCEDCLENEKRWNPLHVAA